jgi:hypothetical protein
MMRKAKWFVAAALVMSTAGCVETMDSGYAAPSYGYGYGNGYGNGYYSNGYYAQPAFYSPPVVYSQTRYVPVPQHYADHSNDHRWDGDHRRDGDHRADARHDEPRHVEHQTSAPQPATHNTSSSSHHDGNRHDGSHDTEHRG